MTQPARKPQTTLDPPRDRAEAIKTYPQMGIRITPVSQKTKKPRLPEWNDPDKPLVAEADFKATDNVGGLMGSPIGSTPFRIYDVDVDTNTDAARRLVWRLIAQLLTLKEPSLQFGRASKPRSHGLYASQDLVEGRKFLAISGKASIEFRGLTKKQKFTNTVLPGSTHESGELVRFEEPVCNLAEVDGQKLFEAVRLAAVGLVIIEVWPTEGKRHEARLAFARVLLERGVSEDHAIAVLEAVMHATNSDERDVSGAVTSTAARLKDDDKARGGTWIADNIEHGREALKAIGKILDQDVDDGSINVHDTSHEMIDRAWSELAKANTPPGLFQRGEDIVILPDGPHTFLNVAYKQQLECRPESKCLKGTRGFRVIGVDTVRDVLARVVRCTRPTKHGRQNCAPTSDFARLMLASPFLPLPQAQVFSSVPFFAPDGELVTEPGLHLETGIYYFPDAGLSLPEVPKQPTHEQVQQALAHIDDLVWQFPFADREFPFTERRPEEFRRTEYANMLAFPLTVLTRGLVNGNVPAFLFDKPTSRTGASLLVQCLSYLVLGDWPAESEWDKSESERRKFLTAILMTGAPIVFLDDIKDLNSSDLRKIVTGSGRLGRELGKTNILDAPNLSTFVATGCNPAYNREMAGRIARVRLDANIPSPEDRRGFAIIPKEWVPAHRNSLLWSFYVLVQAWVAKGRPAWDDEKLAGFETWSRTIGGILHAAGVEGFLGNRKDVTNNAEDEDDDIEIDGAMLDEWISKFQSGVVTVGKLLTLENVPKVDGIAWGARRFGPYLRTQRGRWRKLSDGRWVCVEKVADEGWRLRVRVSGAFKEAA